MTPPRTVSSADFVVGSGDALCERMVRVIVEASVMYDAKYVVPTSSHFVAVDDAIGHACTVQVPNAHAPQVRSAPPVLDPFLYVEKLGSLGSEIMVRQSV